MAANASDLDPAPRKRSGTVPGSHTVPDALARARTVRARCVGMLRSPKSLICRALRWNERWRWDRKKCLDAEHAKLEAKKAPYRKVLAGDKLNLIEKLWGDAWYGVGGDPLDTPEKLNAAAAWFGVVTWTDDADGKTHWLVRKYAFRGNTAVGNATERKGCCDSPSSRDYR